VSKSSTTSAGAMRVLSFLLAIILKVVGVGVKVKLAVSHRSVTPKNRFL
jgi:hypothetical protein